MSNDHNEQNDDIRNEQAQLTQPTTTAGEMSLALIEEQADRTIRRVWHEGQWYFSIIDVIGVLTDSPRPRKYWHALKTNMQQ